MNNNVGDRLLKFYTGNTLTIIYNLLPLTFFRWRGRLHIPIFTNYIGGGWKAVRIRHRYARLGINERI
jgi:hypothetical protein